MNKLHVEKMGRGFAWLDTGTPDALLEAIGFVRALEQRQGFRIAYPEEVAFHLGWVSPEHLANLRRSLAKSSYGQYSYLSRKDRFSLLSGVSLPRPRDKTRPDGLLT